MTMDGYKDDAERRADWLVAGAREFAGCRSADTKEAVAMVVRQAIAAERERCARIIEKKADKHHADVRMFEADAHGEIAPAAVHSLDIAQVLEELAEEIRKC
jgi:hypothetical protein